jgi:hypothetical protein
VTLLKESLNRGDDEPDQWKHANKILGATAWVTAEEAQQSRPKARALRHHRRTGNDQPAVAGRR